MSKILIVLYTLFVLVTTLNAKDAKIEHYGDSVQIALPVIAYATSLALNDSEGQMQFYKSFLSTFATTHTLKYTVNEERPNGSDTKSFPSGHTSASFQGAAFIHARYGFTYAIPAYLGASFVAYSRVYADKHYTHDVLAGALIGTGFSFYFSTPYKYKTLEIEPVVYNSIDYKNTLYGIRVTW